MTGDTVAFRAMGTQWWAACDEPVLLGRVARVVRDVEARLSRFRPGSALSVLNRARQATDPVLAQVVAAAGRMHRLTGGAFDPTLGAPLVALGYRGDFAQVEAGARAPRPSGGLRVHVDGDTVRLDGPGALDLGGIAKGWAVDLVHDTLLRAGACRVLVDGGGDLRGTGACPVGVGEDGAVWLDGGLATSSTRHRRWRTRDGAEVHHILDPRTGAPSASEVATATVRAADAATADALATALIVDPQGVIARLPALGATAWIADAAGAEWVTPGWEYAA